MWVLCCVARAWDLVAVVWLSCMIGGLRIGLLGVLLRFNLRSYGIGSQEDGFCIFLFFKTCLLNAGLSSGEGCRWSLRSHMTAVILRDKIYMYTLCFVRWSVQSRLKGNSTITELRAPHLGVFLLRLRFTPSERLPSFILFFTVIPQCFSLDLSFCQAWYEVPDFVCLEHTFQLCSRTILASGVRDMSEPIHLGLLGRLPAQKAPPLTRSVRCRRYDSLIITILALT